MGTVMKVFDTGVTFIRKTALKAQLIADSDNDDILVQRVCTLIKSAPEDVCAKIREDITKAGDKLKEPEPILTDGTGFGDVGNTGQQS